MNTNESIISEPVYEPRELTVTTTFSARPSLIAKARARAAAEGRTFSNYVVWAIYKDLAGAEPKPKPANPDAYAET